MIRGYHRWHLMLRGFSRRALRDLALAVHGEEHLQAKRSRVTVSIDVDPVGIL
jgi:primosomal protein N'